MAYHQAPRRDTLSGKSVKSALRTAIVAMTIAFGAGCSTPVPAPPEFVTLEGKQFKTKGQDFFPVTVNYIVDFITTGEGFSISTTYTYEQPHSYEYSDPDSLDIQLNAHFSLIREMGFNSIRLCLDRIREDEKGIYYSTNHYSGALYIDENTSEILDAFENVITIAAQNDLRVMPLIRAPHLSERLPAFTEAFLKRFSDNPTVFAYDFFNEPLYFDKDHNQKKEAYNIVQGWRKMMDKHAPHQLMCIGFSEPIEVFRWDPSILPVDFIAFHTYHPLRIQNEIYWYSKFIDKPWMIGETSLPADNDSISYEEQRQFMKETVRLVRSCGGSGFGWWEFQDEPAAGRFDASFNGMLNNSGVIKREGHHQITGTLKPAAFELEKALQSEETVPCTCAVNYQNILGYSNLLVEGRVVDKKTGAGIEGAVIRGWNTSWAIGMNTFTDSEGRFTLYSNEPCTHFEISAPGRELLKFDRTHSFTPTSEDAPPIDQLPNRDLEYHNIHYQPFLKTDSIPDRIESDFFIFDFDPKLFNKAHYRADAGTFKLEKLSF